MSVRTFKKGEVIYKDGDKITAVYLIQSGGVNQCLIKGKKSIDLFQLGSSQILGDQVILGQNTHLTSAIATTETKVLEIPVEVFRNTFDTSPQMVKGIIKSLADRLRLALNEVRSSKLEKDSSPCPEDQVARAFAAVFHTVLHKGKKTPNNQVAIEWSLFKQYGQRVMGESPKRMEQVVNILVKTKLAKYEMGKSPDNPEGPDEIQKAYFFNLDPIENFFEFYQYYYFKSGKIEILKLDELCQQMLEGMLLLAQGQSPDRLGIVSINFAQFAEYFKKEIGINLNNDHFTRLESKGAFIKRHTNAEGVVLQFELKEFNSLYMSWRFLREIEKWNEKSFVDINEKEEKQKKKTSGGPSCPACQAEIQANAKFCSECGHKIVSAA